MAWSCDFCPEIPPFENEEEFKAHKKKHSFYFECSRPWCSVISRSEKSLLEHDKICTFPHDPIKCSSCEVQLSGRSAIRNYRKHLKRSHQKSPGEIKVILSAELAKVIRLDSVDKKEEDDRPPPKKQKIETPCVVPETIYKIPTSSNMKDRKILTNGRLTILYGYEIRGPRVAHLTLTKENVTPIIIKKKKCENQDNRLEKATKTTMADFADASKEMKIEKGHIQASFFLRVDKDTAAAVPLLSAVLPQLRDFNDGTWKELEKYETWLLKRKYDKIDSFTGPIFFDDVGTCGSRLPLASHFFMLLICHLPNGQVDVEIFVLEHKEHQPGIGINTFYKTYAELISMDKDNFIPRFVIKNVRNFNGVEFNGDLHPSA